MKNETKRSIPKKNYIKAVLLFIGVVGVVLYARQIILLREENNLNRSSLSRVIGEIKDEEITNVFVETSSSYFVYINNTNSKEIQEFEEKIKNYIVNNDLQNNFYYLNVTERNEDESLISDLNKKLKTNTKINVLPTIIYFKDGEYQNQYSIDVTNINIKNIKKYIKNTYTEEE